MIKKIKEIIKERKEQKEWNRHMRDLIQFTTRNIETGKETTQTMDRLGFSNFMVYCYDEILIDSKCIKKAS